MFNRLKGYGFGISSRGTAYTPLSGEQESPDPPLPISRPPSGRPHFEPASATPLMHARAQAAAARREQQSSGGASDAGLNDEHGYTAVFEHSKYLAGNPRRRQGQEVLMNALHELAQSPRLQHYASAPDTEDHGAGFRGAPMKSIAMAVHAVCETQQRDCHAAQRALRVLGQIDLDAELRAMSRPLQAARRPETRARNRIDPQDEQMAWRIACRLGSSKEGLRLLRLVCRPSPDTNGDRTSTSPAHHADPEIDSLALTLMTVANALAAQEEKKEPAPRPAQTPPSLQPAALYRNALEKEQRRDALALLDKAVLALGRRFAPPGQESAADAARSHDWAIAAVNNGFLDAESMKAPNARLEKLVTEWVDRVVENATQLNPVLNKSPFFGLTRTAGNGPIRFAHVDQNALARNRVMADTVHALLAVCEERTTANDKALRHKPDLKNDPCFTGMRMRNAVHEEMLRFWSGNNQFLRLTDEKPIPAPDMKRLFDRVCARLVDRKDDRLGFEAAEDIKGYMNDQNQPLKPETLARLADDLQVGTHEALRVAITGIGEQTTMTHFDRKNLSETLCLLLDRMDKGSRLSLSSGGVLGINTRGISVSLSRLTQLLTLRLRADLRHEHARQAVFELGVMTHGVEIVAGSQTIRRNQLGTGVFAGFDIHRTNKALMLGAGLDAGGFREVTSTSSVVLRLPRPDAGLPEMNKTVADLRDVIPFLLETLHDRLQKQRTGQGSGANDASAAASSGASSAEPVNMLAELFQRFPDLSIGQKGSSSPSNTTSGFKISGIAGAVLKLGLYRAGASILPEAEWRRAHDYRYFEKTGRVRIERFTKGSTVRAAVTGGFNAGSLAVPIVGLSGRSDHRTIDQGGGRDAIRGTFGTPNIDVMQLNREFFHSGASSRITIVSEHGEVSARSSNVVIYHTVNAFADAIRGDLEHWVGCMTRRWLPDAWARDGKHRKQAMGQERAKLLHFLDDVVRNAEPTQSYQAHLEIRPQVVRELNSLYEAARQCDDKESLADIDRAIQARIHDDNAWEPAHLVAYDGASKQKKNVLDMLVKAGRIHNMGSTRIAQII